MRRRQKGAPIELGDIQGTLTSSSGNGSKTITRLGKKTTSKPVTCSLQVGVRLELKR
jgi:hypothetical protein